MDCEKLWNDFCYHVEELQVQGCREDVFQKSAEFIFEKLGWSKRDGEIISQLTMQRGSNSFTKPDIVVQSGGKKHFVAELKRPNIQLTNKNQEQIIDYMRRLRLDFGLLIGKSLQIFYETDNRDDPICITEIPFTENNADGIELIGVITNENYSYERFKRYCENKVAAKQEQQKINDKIAKLCSTQGKEIVALLLKKELEQKFSEGNAQMILSQINIAITKKSVCATDSDNSVSFSADTKKTKQISHNKIQEVRPFFIELEKYIEKYNLPLVLKTNQDRRYANVFYKKGVKIEVDIIERENRIRVGIYMTNQRQLFDKLYEQKNEIEEKTGFSLGWKRELGKTASRIEDYVSGLNDVEKVSQRLVAFKNVFIPLFEQYNIK